MSCSVVFEESAINVTIWGTIEDCQGHGILTIVDGPSPVHPREEEQTKTRFVTLIFFVVSYTLLLIFFVFFFAAKLFTFTLKARQYVVKSCKGFLNFCDAEKKCWNGAWRVGNVSTNIFFLICLPIPFTMCMVDALFLRQLKWHNGIVSSINNPFTGFRKLLCFFICLSNIFQREGGRQNERNTFFFNFSLNPIITFSTKNETL